jgi:hypothetical protein
MMNPSGSGASACVSRVAEVAEIEAAKVRVGLIIHNQTIAGRFWGLAALARRCGLDIPNWQLPRSSAETIDAASTGGSSDDARFRPPAPSQRLTVNTAVNRCLGGSLTLGLSFFGAQTQKNRSQRGVLPKRARLSWWYQRLAGRQTSQSVAGQSRQRYAEIPKIHQDRVG